MDTAKINAAVQATIQPFTELKSAEEALRQVAIRYARALEVAAGQGTPIVDRRT